MSYKTALEAAGAKILEFNSFGTHQGEWVALAKYMGETGWVMGSFGSCEFGYVREDHDYDKRLKTFGESYLDGMMSTNKTVEYFQNSADWDIESSEAAKWVLKTGKRYGIK